MSIYVKIAFTLAGDVEEECWLKSGHRTLGATAYAAANLCSGYYVGSAGRAATVVTVTTEEPAEVLKTLDEILARLEGASPQPDAAGT